jgi:SAM-dependent methyltransferase
MTELTNRNQADAPDTPPSSARRVCPRCGAPDKIVDGSLLWPKDWRCGCCDFVLDVKNDFVRLSADLDEVDEGFALESYEILSEAEDGHFWFSTRNDMIGWLIGRFAARARHALEIGCGTGYVLYALRNALPGAAIAGSELRSRGLDHARRRHLEQVELLQMDARHCGLRDAIDFVGAFDVLEHIPDDEGVLREIHRMLKPGGVLIATVPQHPWLWSAVDETARHQRRYTVGELATKARKAGLHVRYQSSFATLVFPLMALDRWRMRKDAAYTNNPEVRLPRRLNAALTALFRTEHLLRRMRLPLPFGGSQVVAGRRNRRDLPSSRRARRDHA